MSERSQSEHLGVAIVGSFSTDLKAVNRSQSIAELVFEAVQGLYDDCGADRDDVDNFISASSDFWDGRTISDMAIQDAVGAYMSSESKVSSDATLALLYGAMRILSGQYETTLVVSHAKPSEGDSILIENAAFEPEYQRRLGVDSIQVAGLQAQLAEHRGRVTAADRDQTVRILRSNAEQRGRAIPWEFDPDESSGSPELLSDPLTQADQAPYADGASALLLASERRAHDFTTQPIWLRGFGHCQEPFYIGERDLLGCPALATASKSAYLRSSVENPKASLDIAEISTPFSHELPLYCDTLGLPRIDEKDGPAINPSGGSFAGRPPVVDGLLRVDSVYRHLLERSGTAPRGPETGSLGLAHGTLGAGGTTHCVWILESRGEQDA